MFYAAREKDGEFLGKRRFDASELAYAGYYIADKKGYKKAKEALESLSKKMSPEQLDKAQKIIAEQKPETLKPKPTSVEKIKANIAKFKEIIRGIRKNK